jgi:outer membrane protein assembly factor BamB
MGTIAAMLKRMKGQRWREVVPQVLGLGICVAALAMDQPQWGQRFTRNMVSDEKGLPDTADPRSSKNIKWVAQLGDQTYSTPVVSGGRVFIGTNNEQPRHAGLKSDSGVLMCFDEKDGRFCWQLVAPKLGPDPYLDWPKTGLVSPVTAEGNRLYLVNNRAEVLCLDLQGQANGNDGPYRDEGQHAVPRGAAPVEPGAADADIIWLYDLVAQAGVYPHDGSHCSILAHGDFLYICTSNGVDNTHRKIRAPDAPGLVVLDKRTGRMVARDFEGMAPRTIHSTWASPSLAEVAGQTLVFFGGGDGICYAFKAVKQAAQAGAPARLEAVWRFDCDPTAPKQDIHKWQDNFQEGPSNITSMPVFHENRVYVIAGGDIWHGKPWAWVKCLEAATGRERWSYRVSSHCVATPAIHEGRLYVGDCGGKVHCVDIATGGALWTYEAGHEIWSSTLVADGKLYFGTRRGELCIMAAAKEKQVIDTIRLDSAINGTPTAANGVVYVATMRKLYALQSAPNSAQVGAQ